VATGEINHVDVVTDSGTIMRVVVCGLVRQSHVLILKVHRSELTVTEHKELVTITSGDLS
jgi:hypothetical protein